MTTERGARRLVDAVARARPRCGGAGRTSREEFAMNRNGGLGIVGVIIVVLVILWLVGVIKL